MSVLVKPNNFWLYFTYLYYSENKILIDAWRSHNDKTLARILIQRDDVFLEGVVEKDGMMTR